MAGVSAGWYDDGATAGVVRWFDGAAWTEHTRPVSPPAVVPMPYAAPAAAAPSMVGTAPYASYQQVGVHQPTGYGAAPSVRYPGGADYVGPITGFGQLGQLGDHGGLVGTPPHGFGADVAAIAKLRRRVVRDLVLGIVWLLFGATLAFFTAHLIRSGLSTTGRSHYVSTGGMIAGVASFVRARRWHQKMVEAGGQPWSKPARTWAVVGGSLALLLSVTGVIQAFNAVPAPGSGPAVAGSCWANSGGVHQVDCASPHDWVGTALVQAGTPCPDEGQAELDLRDGSGQALCLAADPTSGVPN